MLLLRTSRKTRHNTENICLNIGLLWTHQDQRDQDSGEDEPGAMT